MAFREDISLQLFLLLTYTQEFTPPEILMQTKSQKKLVLTGAARFNAKPKTGLAFLEEQKLIYADLSPEMSRERSLATFLKGCTRLDKRLLGDFISKPENIDVLKAFIGLFDWKDVSAALPGRCNSCVDIAFQKHIADAMRELLETFRLPGEAQQISRITETFAEIYFAAKPGSDTRCYTGLHHTYAEPVQLKSRAKTLSMC